MRVEFRRYRCRIAFVAAFSVACLAILAPRSRAQDSLTPPPGLRDGTPNLVALVGAKLVVSPGKVIEGGTLIVRDGLIVAVGKNLPVPPGAAIRDLAGKTVYPGFIDAYSELDVPAPKAAGYWNADMRASASVAAAYAVDGKANEALRAQGITARLVAPKEGTIRGLSAVVTTGSSNPVLHNQAALHVNLMPDDHNHDHFPASPMGAVALVRQAMYDARWHAAVWKMFEAGKEPIARPERSAALQALEPYAAGKQLVIFETQNELYALRADQIAKEFKLRIALHGSGHEYRRLDAIAAAGWPVIVPLDFPKAPYVKTPEAALAVSLERLQHWDHAPENPARLAAAGVPIAFTSHGLPKDAKFLDRVRETVRRGLPADQALAALTTNAATLLGVEAQLGSLAAGKAANLVVTNGDVFQKETKVLETWVDGTRHEIEETKAIDVRGTWQVRWQNGKDQPEQATLTLAGTPEKLSGKIKNGGAEGDLLDVSADRFAITARFPGDVLGSTGQAHLSGVITPGNQQTPTFTGMLYWSDGTHAVAKASLQFDEQIASDEDKAEASDDGAPVEAPAVNDKPADEKPELPAKALFPINYPLGAFGRSEPPQLPNLVAFEGGTVWTCGPAGVMEDATVLVERGRIQAVGPRDKIKLPKGTLVVDCRGKHLTPGIIDCHSHIATDGGINEPTQSITAEVRIGDFIDPNDVNIYRQLAGGVTSSNILHGSANTIGGQNQVIKMRWGSLPEDMKFAEAKPGIKFALGENVKQSNWGDKYRTRYPQSRMGVEQLVRDAFEAAQDYQRRWDAWKKKPQGAPPRVDLELAALSEVVAGERLVHCHSYRQDEILALLRTCESYGVRIGTLQHILEGYKLADEIAKHGAGASSFSDWWAYKYEVWDAIPYNGALMHQQGVVVSFNSDDAELARRLNGEAAKAIKYGQVPPEEALKFVTLNPAKQLQIDRYVGSVEKGKQADLALWSGQPLSPLSFCEQTWIDGRKYFDRQDDIAARSQVQAQKAALIQRILTTKAPMAGLDEEPADKTGHWPREDTFCHGHDHGH